MDVEEEESYCVGHEPCPSCGSSDNLARYSDGHAYCFSMGCNHYEPADNSQRKQKASSLASKKLITTGEVRAVSSRSLSEETCRKFGYAVAKVAYDEDEHGYVSHPSGKPCQVATYHDRNGGLVAQKLRFADKSFTFQGSFKEAALFGQHLWGAGGRKIVITEGEIDCMSVSQMQGNKWPVVSIQNGAGGAKKSLVAQLEWLNTFEEVILMFDQDRPGQQATEECARLFPPGKCKIATLTRKDPNELLVNGEGDQIINAIWSAKPYRPDGIVTLADVKDEILKPIEHGLPWWSKALTELTYGRRSGEIYALGAGTGIGKTDFLTQQIVYDITELNEAVSIFFLEQQPKETGKRLAGKFAGKRFHIPEGGYTQEELSEAVDKLEAGGKLSMYDNFGACDWEVIREIIRFQAHGEGTRLFYIDHLTALAAAEEDERKALEQIMAEMGALVKELDIIIHLISHLATPDGTPHEEGGRVMIRHFKGSRAIGFWCHYMFGMERNQHDEDPGRRSVTTFRVLKDRHTGNATGECVLLGYDTGNGNLFETSLPVKPESHGFRNETVHNDEVPF